MARHNYLTALDRLTSDISLGKSPKLAMVVQEDLGLGLAVEYLKRNFADMFEVVELDCNLELPNFEFAPVRELMKNFYPLDEGRVKKTVLDAFIADAFAGKYDSTLIIFSNIQNISPLEFDRLSFFLNSLRGSGLKVLVSYRDSGKNETGRLRYEAAMRRVTDDVVNIVPVTIDQFEFLLKKQNYILPQTFASQLFRLSNGSIELFRYAVSYYRTNGIIPGNNVLVDDIYRNIPIPPTMEDHFSSVFRKLDAFSRSILYLVSISGRISVSEIMNVFERSVESAENAVDKLLGMGFIISEAKGLRISGSRIPRLIFSLCSEEEKIDTGKRLVKAPFFEGLPVNLKISILWRIGQFDQCTDLLRNYTDQVAAELKTLENVQSFVARLRRKRINEELEELLSLLECEGFYRYGNREDAVECYREVEVGGGLITVPVFRIAEIQLQGGDYPGSRNTLEKSGLEEAEDPAVSASYHLNLARVILNIGDLDEVMHQAQLASSIANENGLNSMVAEAKYILGILSIDRKDFASATRYLDEATKVCRESDDPDTDLLLRISGNRAIISAELGNYEEAIEKFQDIIWDTYYTGDRIKRAYGYFNLLEAFEITGNHAKFEENVQVAGNSVELVNDVSLEFEFHRLKAFHYHNSTEYDKAVSESEKCIELAERIGDSQWIAMSRAMYDISQSFIDGKVRKENWDSMSKGMEKNEDIMPFFLSSSMVYFMLQGEIERFTETMETLNAYNVKAGEFFGLAVYNISKASVVLYSGNIEEFASSISSLTSKYDSVGLYRAFRKVFGLISRMGKLDQEAFDSQFSVLEQELLSEYPRVYYNSAVAFRAFLESKIRGKSDYLARKLSSENDFSVLTLRALKEVSANVQ